MSGDCTKPAGLFIGHGEGVGKTLGIKKGTPFGGGLVGQADQKGRLSDCFGTRLSGRIFGGSFSTGACWFWRRRFTVEVTWGM